MIDNDLILDAYAHGLFPMADSRDAPAAYWVDPPMRGVIPLDAFNIPRSLKKALADHCCHITVNRSFDAVIAACAESPRADGKGTWINPLIEEIFSSLHKAGHAHSIEVRDKDDRLVGGLYGLAQGGCFNGESMFSLQPNASKIALVYLVGRLKERNFTLLDTQFINDHLLQFGCIEIPRADYLQRLEKALRQDVCFI